jgi:hypothetical protein
MSTPDDPSAELDLAEVLDALTLDELLIIVHRLQDIRRCRGFGQLKLTIERGSLAYIESSVSERMGERENQKLRDVTPFRGWREDRDDTNP